MPNLIVQQAISVIVKDFVLPWVAKKKEVPNKKPQGKKSIKKKVIDDVKAEYEFSPQRAGVIAIIAAALSYAVSGGYISTESADCLQEAGQEVVEKTLE